MSNQTWMYIKISSEVIVVGQIIEVYSVFRCGSPGLLLEEYSLLHLPSHLHVVQLHSGNNSVPFCQKSESNVIEDSKYHFAFAVNILHLKIHLPECFSASWNLPLLSWITHDLPIKSFMHAIKAQYCENFPIFCYCWF